MTSPWSRRVMTLFTTALRTWVKRAVRPCETSWATGSSSSVTSAGYCSPFDWENGREPTSSTGETHAQALTSHGHSRADRSMPAWSGSARLDSPDR